MSNNADLTPFLTGFETHNKKCSIPKEQWARRLLPSLSEKVMKAYSRIKADQRKDYNVIKEAIERDLYRRKLDVLKRETDETTWTLVLLRKM